MGQADIFRKIAGPANEELAIVLNIRRLHRTTIEPYILLIQSGLRLRLLAGQEKENLLTVGASFLGQAVGVAVAWQDTERANLLDLYVLPDYRRAGIGTALLAAVEEEARRSGVSALHALYRANEHTPAFEGLLAAQGWTTPRLQSKVFWTSCSAGYDGWSQRYRFRPPYEPVPWAEITPAERQAIARRGEEGWYPDNLSPFNRPDDDWDAETSLGLRYKGEVVGWLLTIREFPDQIRVEIMFVDPPLQRLGRGILLICEMIRRYCNDGDYAGGCNEHCYWRVSPENEGMIRWSQRSFPGRFTDEYEEWYSEKILIA